MSIPKELLESMLSAYVDDALSADEQTRVEQLLHSDPSVAEQLEQLQSMRAMLKQIDVSDRCFRLPPSFAQSVIEATVSRGYAEGLEERHPVMRLAEQPSPIHAHAVHSQNRSAWWKVVAPVAALAASVAIGFFLLRDSGDREPLALMKSNDGSSENLSSPVVPSAIASPETESSPVQAIEPHRSVPPSPADLAVDSMVVKPESESPMIVSNAGSPTGNEHSVDETLQPNRPEPIKVESVVPIRAILVLNVVQTMDGRNTRAIESAMEQGGLDVASRKSIDEEIVRFAQKSVDSDEADPRTTTVLYLEASVKKLDQMISHLIADEQGIESVEMSLASDTPLMTLVNSLRSVDPTTVRQDRASQDQSPGSLVPTSSTSWKLDATESGIDALVSHLRDRDFARLNASTTQLGVTQSMVGSSMSPSTDVIGRVLMIVR